MKFSALFVAAALAVTAFSAPLNVDADAKVVANVAVQRRQLVDADVTVQRRQLEALAPVLNIAGPILTPVLTKLQNLNIGLDVDKLIKNLPIVGNLLDPVVTAVLGKFNLDVNVFLRILVAITDPKGLDKNLLHALVGKIDVVVQAIVDAKLGIKKTDKGEGIVPNLFGDIDLEAVLKKYAKVSA